MSIAQGSGATGKFAGLSLKAYALVVGGIFPGTPPTTVKSQNATITYVTAVGKYTVTFGTPLASANYMVNFECTEKYNMSGAVSSKTVNGFIVTTATNNIVDDFANNVFGIEVYL